MPDPAEADLLRTAIEHHRAGRLAQAEAGYRQVLAREPNCVEALHYLGQIAFRCGHPAAAAELFQRAANLAPGDATIRGNLAESQRQLHRLDEAVANFKQALALRPEYPIAWSNLGNALTSLGQLDEAIACLRRAIALQPDHANAYNNLGTAHRLRRQFPEAIDCFRRAAALDPGFAEAHNNLGAILVVQGRFEEAIGCFQRALAARPNLADAHNNLAGLLGWRGEIDDAIARQRQAVALEPERADFRSNLILSLYYRFGDDTRLVTAELRRWHERHARPLAAAIAPHDNDRSPERRLRIGYVSADFRDHVVGRNLLPLFKHHAHDAYEILCYACVPAPDALTARFRGWADHWRDVGGLTDAQLAARIREDRIDILVDLALHTAKNRLLTFARKPAPVQVSFAGYPAGNGMDVMDGHLTDPFLEPPQAGDDTGPDVPVRLPATFWCYDPDGAEEDAGPLPAAANGFVTFGCLANLCKVNPAVIALWARVVSAVSGSRLMLLTAEGSHRERIRSRFAQAGLEPERVSFVSHRPRAQYLALYRGIDIGLDTFPYNGHTTSLDSFWMGVPVVTLVGPTSVGRAGWSQLSNLGMTELAGRTPGEFVDIACDLANDLPRLAVLRAALRERMRQSPLMDGPAFARGLEAAYRARWRKWCAR